MFPLLLIENKNDLFTLTRRNKALRNPFSSTLIKFRKVPRGLFLNLSSDSFIWVFAKTKQVVWSNYANWNVWRH